MVCPRCISAVTNLLKELHLEFSDLRLGEVNLLSTPDSTQLSRLQIRLRELGFELIESRQQEIIEKIKLCAREYLTAGNDRKHKLSVYVTKKLPFDYSYLSDLFSSVEGLTIEKYLIQLRIEKVKELLAYNRYSLSEIAEITGYSSSQHLSTQFKQYTGLSPSHFKHIGSQRTAEH